MTFSVIIPALDSAATLGAALDSVRAQRYTDYEVIVVDDGSVDSSADLARAHPVGCRVLEMSRCAGPGAARNAGAKIARGEYLAFLDADDEWFPWSLEIFAEVIDEANRPALLCGIAMRDREGNDFHQDACDLQKFTNYYNASAHHVWIGVGGMAVARDKFIQAGGFAEWDANSEDSDLWLRLGLCPGFVRISSPPLFFYRQTPFSLTKRSERIAPGYMNMVHAEKAGNYPGSLGYLRSRRQIISRHARAGTITLLKLGRLREALALYFATFWWNMALRRIRYLLGFWLVALASLPSRKPSGSGQDASAT